MQLKHWGARLALGALLFAGALACRTTDVFVAQATIVPTRTVRPTFTPLPPPTRTPPPTATVPPSPTPTPTRRPTTRPTPRPPTPVPPPPQATQPPKPQFQVQVGQQGLRTLRPDLYPGYDLRHGSESHQRSDRCHVRLVRRRDRGSKRIGHRRRWILLDDRECRRRSRGAVSLGLGGRGRTAVL